MDLCQQRAHPTGVILICLNRKSWTSTGHVWSSAQPQGDGTAIMLLLHTYMQATFTAAPTRTG